MGFGEPQEGRNGSIPFSCRSVSLPDSLPDSFNGVGLFSFQGVWACRRFVGVRAWRSSKAGGGKSFSDFQGVNVIDSGRFSVLRIGFLFVPQGRHKCKTGVALWNERGLRGTFLLVSFSKGERKCLSLIAHAERS